MAASTNVCAKHDLNEEQALALIFSLGAKIANNKAGITNSIVAAK